jgi:hypothetical protein
MTDETEKPHGDKNLSPWEKEQRLLERERRSWLIWTFGIAGAIVVVIIAGTIAISPGADPTMTGSTPRKAPVQTEAP